MPFGKKLQFRARKVKLCRFVGRVDQSEDYRMKKLSKKRKEKTNGIN